MRPFVIKLTPAAASANGIAQAQNITGGTPMTLNGSLGTTLDYARIIGISSTANVSSSNFVIVGTNSNGEKISETIASGPNNSTVVSTNLYKTITSITPGSTVAQNVTVGTVNTTLSLESIVHNIESKEGAQATYATAVTGTLNYTILESFDRDFYTKGIAYMTWFANSNQSSKTGSTVSSGTEHATAIKIQINSYSSGATLSVFVNTGNRL